MGCDGAAAKGAGSYTNAKMASAAGAFDTFGLNRGGRRTVFAGARGELHVVGTIEDTATMQANDRVAHGAIMALDDHGGNLLERQGRKTQGWSKKVHLGSP